MSTGKNPINENCAVSSPDTDKAVTTALAPGIPITSILFSCASLINIYPGSDIQGVPASVTIAIFNPDFKSLIMN